MRLTLRTMLATLDADDRLDPADVEELAQKIEQSKFASDLAQRIRRVIQHPRLSAPRLDGKAGLDLNSVAEYLDNTLSQEKIAEFERICIASDVQLAEVAACHQILVLVLEQPAEFDPAIRDRMYRLGAEAKRTAADGQRSEVRLAADGTQTRIDRPAAAATPKPKPEVPDYLRQGRRPALWPLALAALLAFLAVGVVLRAMGPFDASHPMARMLRGNNGIAQNPDAQQVPVPDVTDMDADTPGPSDISETDTTDSDAPPAPIDERPADSDALEPPAPSADADMPPIPGDPAAPTTDKPADTLEPRDPPEPKEIVPGRTDSPVPAVADSDMPADPPQPTDLPPDRAPADAQQPPAADVARFVSDAQVMVRRTETGFARVPARAPIFVGDELVVFPAFRPQILMANSVQLTVAGESRIAMGMNDVAVDYGRLLAVSVGKPDASLKLDLGTVRGTAFFDGADSELAIEVRRWLPPGENPQTPAAINVVRLYTTRGKVSWQEGTADQPGETFPIESGEVRNYVADAPGETVTIAAPPDWLDGKNIPDIDRRAARELEAKLAGDRPLELTLREMGSDAERRAEMRALAVRALAQLSEFEPIIRVFNDDSQRAYWSAEFDVLRDVVARNPRAAMVVHDVLVKMYGERAGGDFFRLLWGYSPEDLKNAELVMALVQLLDAQDLHFRVLAFENLRRITGSTQLYQPQFNATRRRGPIAQWREKAQAGEIVYRTPPAPINDPKPAANPPARGANDPLLEP